MLPPSFNQVFIDLKELKHNYSLLRDIAHGAEVLAMVKADGYGHGMIQCAKALEEIGCTFFGVAELQEAILLRENGIQSQILSTTGLEERFIDLVIQYKVTPVVYDFKTIKALSESAIKFGEIIPVHLKVDTGITRLGILPAETKNILRFIDELPGIELTGLASHFPCSDDPESPTTIEGFKKFQEVSSLISKKQELVHHIANSGGTLYFKETHADMVRCGITLYGYYPKSRDILEENGLHPVMSFVTRVLQVKDVSAGTGVSYGHTYVTERDSKIAVIPVGYEDGYSRGLSNKGEVLIRGKRAPIRGRVCMNLLMVDVTDFDVVETGDEVVLLGKQGDDYITADEIASKLDTISYEVLCMIGKNNERVYI